MTWILGKRQSTDVAATGNAIESKIADLKSTTGSVDAKVASLDAGFKLLDKSVSSLQNEAQKITGSQAQAIESIKGTVQQLQVSMTTSAEKSVDQLGARLESQASHFQKALDAYILETRHALQGNQAALQQITQDGPVALRETQDMVQAAADDLRSEIGMVVSAGSDFQTRAEERIGFLYEKLTELSQRLGEVNASLCLQSKEQSQAVQSELQRMSDSLQSQLRAAGQQSGASGSTADLRAILDRLQALTQTLEQFPGQASDQGSGKIPADGRPQFFEILPLLDVQSQSRLQKHADDLRTQYLLTTAHLAALTDPEIRRLAREISGLGEKSLQQWRTAAQSLQTSREGSPDATDELD